MPDAETIIAFQDADVILLNGATYSKWLEHASLPLRKLVDTSAGYREQYMQIAGTGTHSHGPAGDHSHTGTAFTTWIDLRQAAAQAQVVTDALIGLLPKEEDLLQRNSELLVRDLLAIDSSIAAVTVGQVSVPLFASHPVYQYFSRRYGLNMVSVLWEPDVFPADAKWAELRRLHVRHPSQWMVWEAEPLVESVTRLEGMGVQSVVFDPCGNRPEEGDFLTVMRKNVENLRTAFSHRNGKN